MNCPNCGEPIDESVCKSCKEKIRMEIELERLKEELINLELKQKNDNIMLHQFGMMLRN